ncbi:MAG: DUF1513 domain-containing protein [Oleispira sp.]|nr:DUF1513 domain-containing protein [Oleispira sp.]MBL4881964.1 DUF1513 domain-containing protein [Oleispira sp.]
MQRRHFLYSSSLACLFPLTTGLAACSNTDSNKPNSNKLNPIKEVILGGYSETDANGKRLDSYGVIVVQPNKEGKFSIISDFTVPNEVHLATLFPDQKSILVCSRKPGASLLKYSLSGNLMAELKPLKNQHFEGHGIFSIDEKYIYATASDFELKQGRMLKLNSQDLTLIKDYNSGGIGPHELVWQSDKLIAIANTGVLTHPESGRKILNLSSIQSNIVLFDSQQEDIIHQWQVPKQALSARHLDRMANGDLVIGCQYKKKDQRPACIAFANIESGLIFAEPNNENLYWGMKGYTASIKGIPNSLYAMITNPQGHLLTKWKSAADKSLSSELIDQQKIEFNKGLKISRDGKQAWLSIGAGELQTINLINATAKNTSSRIKENIWWGNHLGN